MRRLFCWPSTPAPGGRVLPCGMGRRAGRKHLAVRATTHRYDQRTHSRFVKRLQRIGPRHRRDWLWRLGRALLPACAAGWRLPKAWPWPTISPLIGISAFRVIVHAQPNRGVPVYAVVEAGRSRVAVCRYERIEHAPLFESTLFGPGSWHIYDHKTFLETVQAQAWVCGDIPAALLPALATRTAVAPAWLNLRRAGVLADIAHARWQQGDVDDAAALMPIYPHDER